MKNTQKLAITTFLGLLTCFAPVASNLPSYPTIRTTALGIDTLTAKTWIAVIAEVGVEVKFSADYTFRVWAIGAGQKGAVQGDFSLEAENLTLKNITITETWSSKQLNDYWNRKASVFRQWQFHETNQKFVSKFIFSQTGESFWHTASALKSDDIIYLSGFRSIVAANLKITGPRPPDRANKSYLNLFGELDVDSPITGKLIYNSMVRTGPGTKHRPVYFRVTLSGVRQERASLPKDRLVKILARAPIKASVEGFKDDYWYYCLFYGDKKTESPVSGWIYGALIKKAKRLF